MASVSVPDLVDQVQKIIDVLQEGHTPEKGSQEQLIRDVTTKLQHLNVQYAKAGKGVPCKYLHCNIILLGATIIIIT